MVSFFLFSLDDLLLFRGVGFMAVDGEILH